LIKSFKDPETSLIFDGQVSKKLPPDMQRTAQRKLRYLHGAKTLQDLRAVPGNRLEKMEKEKEREGQWAIRINDQWRICFYWGDGDATEVEITDYH
jgi:toxin HigB-1